ncbi:ubiquitin carboxyl-terminal hydrolase 48 isoform X2 [Lingula anatina]|uniref:Ubiquitin carboxyl-terminal hydrolase 48 n=1 Tax=Lingula anatina TaxID=7574 RepID=A0A1S3HC47_LINAN|nr:ubiquitin carboxyl-terminal hydrolase 48 isoform X2 [Lingula anatina]|eukprot:XP_013383086.1 ubiquitin carboxyl-terminal hydrolase 48 isoform X2 [Lingula anatina]
MAPKQQLDKAAWQWAETVEPEAVTWDHVETAYRIHLKPCKRGACRRNCKGNPNCLNCLGEREWLGEIDDSNWHDIEDPETERRKENAFVGLKNLGATCYVNTYLQVWFHNPTFRAAIYEYQDEENRSALEMLTRGSAADTSPYGSVKPQSAVTKSSRSYHVVSNSEAVTSSVQKASSDSQLCRRQSRCESSQPRYQSEANDVDDDNVQFVSTQSAISDGRPGSSQNVVQQGFSQSSAGGVGSVSSPSAATDVQSGSAVSDVQSASYGSLVSDFQPKSPCGQLQLIFALLQCSNRRYIDPSGLIHCLGLDAGQQQDAQEFCKLFMSLLEESLATQANPAVRHIVQQQFSGQYAYVTRCQGCGRCSERMSEFNELDLNIKGHRELPECIEEFLEEEKLEGDNQYMCQQCGSKQNATRKISLRSLPPVLNLQLLRFVFDRTTGHKKKLNTYIQFPEILDMSKYIELPEHSVQYDLCAVLIHRGPSAYSGHYIAHIQDRSRGTWHKFNDEEIEKMGGKKLQLGNEDEIPDAGSKGPAKPKAAKGYHASRNAYMLVYRRRNMDGSDREKPEGADIQMPAWLEGCVRRDNAKFEDWVQDMTVMRDKNVAMGRARHQEILTLYDKMQVKEGADFEWIETAWVSKWLQDDLQPPAVDNTALLCSHGRINPDKVPQMKCISVEAAETIYAKYKGSPRLKSSQMCLDCVKERCRVIRTKTRMTEDNKYITALLKNKVQVDGPGSYWVGKASLRSWKRLVLEDLESSLLKNGASSLNDENQDEQISLSGKCERDSMDGDGPDTVGFSFNEDALCEAHGNLSTDDACRRLVSSDIWTRLKVYFPHAPEFIYGTEPCVTCMQIQREVQEAQRLNKTLAMTQRNALSDLFHSRNRPAWKMGLSALNIVNRGFLEQWTKFIRDPLRFDTVPAIQNSLLLCPHGGFMFQPHLIEDKTDILSLVWPQEWEILKKAFDVDVEIQFLCVKQEESGKVSFSTVPETCTDCCQARVQQEQQERQQYRDAKIFVRKITPDFKNGAASSAENSDRDDPEFMQANGGKRKKSEALTIAPEKLQKLDSCQLRRSGRHRKVRGEKDFIISSDNSLRDLKLQIMRQFSVAPFDQHLMLGGQHLTDDHAKLGSLNIFPGDILYLKVDEPTEEALMMDDLARAAYPEQGFKGTGLHGSMQQ